jgi:hypothetical protein
MFALLSRSYGEKQTTGCLYIFDGDRAVANVKSLELPYLNNQHDISCIPEGVYECELIYHKKFGVCYLLKDVPDREDIIIHIFNYAAGKKVETRGCIGPGLRFVDINQDGNLDLQDSTKAMNLLRSVLPTKFKIYIL